MIHLPNLGLILKKGENIMLLIITPSKFLSSIELLKTHKEQTGILTTIVTLEDVYRDCNKGDEAEKVKRCIADLHRKQGHKYVLLVGDSDTFPVRYTKTDRRDQDAFNTAFYPTDLYYAALFKQDGSFDTWDANNNGYYGELNGETHSGLINVDQVSLIPTVAVGRIPASTIDEVNCYVQKVIHYEKQAFKSDWVKRALLMATDDWHKDACKTHEKIANDYLSEYSCKILSSKGSTCSSADSLTSLAVTEGFNSGVGLVAYIGHGSPGNLAIPLDFWGTKDIPNLTNSDQLPVMVVSACNTAMFAPLPPYSPYIDINNVSHKGTTDSEHFNSFPPQPACLQPLKDPDHDLATRLTVRTNAGVIAYLGGITGIQYSWPLEYFLQNFPNCSTVGKAWQLMINQYYKNHSLPESLNAPHWPDVARFHQPWKNMLFGDPSLRISGVPRGGWSAQQITLGDRGTSAEPALELYQNKLFMAWKGKEADQKIYYSSFDQNTWSQQLSLRDRGSSHGPAMAAYQNKLFMVWKGMDDDPKIYFSTYERNAWSPQLLTSGDRGTSHGPALTVFQNKLFMVWKGKDNDPKMYYSTFDGNTWSPQQLIARDRGTSHKPALAVYQNKLFMVWKGKATDPKIYFCTFDGNSWTPQQLISDDSGTSHGPALAVYQNKLYMVYKGKEDDPKIFFSIFEGNTWSTQHVTSGDRGTSDTPQLAVFENKLFIVWKGKEDDPKIYFSYTYKDN